MAPIIQALSRNAVSYAGWLLAIGSLVWLALLREGAPEERAGWEVATVWHEEGKSAGEAAGETEMAEVEAPAEGSGKSGADEDAARPLEAEPKKRERPVVMVDAGHGGGDGGAVWNGIIEKNLALTLAQKLKAHLEKLGVDVEMTRSKDQFVPLESRAAITNRVKADAFVSVHLNSAANDAGVRGIETYYSTNKSLGAVRALQAAFKLPSTVGLRDRRGEKLAAVVQRLVCEATGASNRGTKERAYTVVHGASCPAVLVECGFISNPKEAALLKTRAYQEKLAGGIARGIASYLHGLELDPSRGIEVPKPEGGEPALVKAGLVSKK